MATLPSSLKNIKPPKNNTNMMPLLQKTVHSGWMWKKGAKNQLVNRRWFEIKGDQLYYFKEKGDSHVLGQIALAGNEVRRVNSLVDSSSGKYVFELTAGKERKDRPVYEKHDTLIFGTMTPYEMEEWIKAINRIIYTPNGGGMFGRPLQETVKIDSRRGGGMVPIVVEKCVQFLEEKAITEEGVFRVPGLKDDVEQLKTAFNKGKLIDFEETNYKVNIIASVLKQFIGDLPESVIPPLFYDEFIAVEGNCKDKDDALRLYKDILKRIPIENFNLLKYLMRFLYHLQSYAETTKMSLSNLSLVFGPNILRPQNEDPSLLLKSLNDVNATTMALITYQEDLFPITDDEYYYQPVEEPQNDKPSLSAVNLLYKNSCDHDDGYSPGSPSETFLDAKQLSIPMNDLRRSRSEGNLYQFVVGLEETPADSGKDYYDWSSHVKKEIEGQRKNFQLQIHELENKLLAEMKIREMLKLRLNDEHKARIAAEERLELYRAGIEDYCKMFGNNDIVIP